MSKYKVRIAASGTHYVLVSDLFRDRELVNRMMRAARPPERNKMNANLTDITVILDESGSMLKNRGSVIEGFNSMLDEQAKLSRNTPKLQAKLSVYTFNDQVRQVYQYFTINTRNLDNLYLDNRSYDPKGSTSLLDAIGKAIDETGSRLASMTKQDRPGNVMIMIMSDGEENSSRHFDYQQISDKINHQQSKYNWIFKFIGTDQDVIASAAKLHIAKADTLSYTNDAGGYKIAYTGISNSIGNVRTDNGSDWKK